MRPHVLAMVLPQVVDNMYCLWAAGERDMLNTENQYNLRNTGQGLQRVQVRKLITLSCLLQSIAARVEVIAQSQFNPNYAVSLK